MKVAIPTRNNVVDDHFGHCEYYTIFTISEDKLIVCTEIQASPEGCGCKSNIASVLEEKGVELMLAGNMGEGAKHTLEDHHIRVIRGMFGQCRSSSQCLAARRTHRFRRSLSTPRLSGPSRFCATDFQSVEIMPLFPILIL